MDLRPEVDRPRPADTRASMPQHEGARIAPDVESHAPHGRVVRGARPTGAGWRARRGARLHPAPVELPKAEATIPLEQYLERADGEPDR